ncbi:MAG: GIY-YIG nuclease family protein [Bacteroidales bacterium]|nr:GIY-YIG nuclease family protein [Bacteroidales bacterium]
MKIFYVYILKCSDKTYYTGITNNLERRIKEHREGINITAYTYKRSPIELVYFEIFQFPNEAIAFEKQIKKWSRKKKEALIERNYNKLKEYARCNNDTSHLNFKR